KSLVVLSSYDFFVHDFFLSFLHSPMCSPLFPYTTLFRSDQRGHCFACTDSPGSSAGVRFKHRARRAWPDREVGYALDRSGRLHRDRKSTRLNSSHDQISYAVFCLKKKKLAARYSLNSCSL